MPFTVDHLRPTKSRPREGRARGNGELGCNDSLELQSARGESLKAKLEGDAEPPVESRFEGDADPGIAGFGVVAERVLERAESPLDSRWLSRSPLDRRSKASTLSIALFSQANCRSIVDRERAFPSPASAIE